MQDKNIISSSIPNILHVISLFVRKGEPLIQKWALSTLRSYVRFIG